MTRGARPVLEVRSLTTVFDLAPGVRGTAVDGVSLAVRTGETVAIVGESGCGKTVLGLSLLRLVRPPGRIAEGAVLLDGKNILGLTDGEMRQVRGNEIAMIFQEPSTSLNPLQWVGVQVAEALLVHGRSSPKTVREEVVELFRLVGIPAPDLRYASYPHELSGGMRQRVVIAMALACRPRVIVADEPTTALDVTVQAQVLDLIDDLKRRLGTAVVLITHDLGVVAQWSDRIVVLYAGRKVEEGPTDEVLDDPRHPYTRALLAARPELDGDRGALAEIPGLVPAITNVPSGCAFADRCAHAFEACRRERPPLVRIGAERTASCFLLAREGVAA